MNTIGEIQTNRYLRELFDENQEVRLNAINQLGELGDELCLEELQRNLHFITMERQALITAITRLKNKLNVT
jgi:hypothetical protein